jgi:hypothetical protein
MITKPDCFPAALSFHSIDFVPVSEIVQKSAAPTKLYLFSEFD